LQFCWVCINWDIPWNPARLEQRMGRVHRYGQKHDPVLLFNMVAPDTREGRVLETLLEKLQKIRDSLNSDKVFDCVGAVLPSGRTAWRFSTCRRRSGRLMSAPSRPGTTRRS
ncbi:MAG: SWF/SNF helicase family protein, partial [Desulfovibrio sp.]|nr:SWF/SNF helicase family protein [Desulfovibrio sp.]